MFFVSFVVDPLASLRLGVLAREIPYSDRGQDAIHSHSKRRKDTDSIPLLNRNVCTTLCCSDKAERTSTRSG